MAEIQHRDARKLLRIISSNIANSEKLTYRDAAILMGRPPNHSRAVAQMCDLLDAAACLADVPLLALLEVRNKSKGINPKAFKKDNLLREAIIKRSSDYQFDAADIKAISQAIGNLGQRGNRRAWKYVESLFGKDLRRRLTGSYSGTESNAIDDLGTDAPDRAKSLVWSYTRDKSVRDAVLLRAKGKCEFCGRLGFMKSDGSRYLEAHHIIALAKDGCDRITNVIALCPNDHREAHFGEKCEQIEAQMIEKIKAMSR